MGGAIGGAASLVGNIIGGQQASSQYTAADQLNARALEEIQNVGLPPDLSKEVLLEKYRSAGTLTPELEQAIEQASSQLAQIEVDPTIKQAQMNALSQLQQRARTGLSPEDIAAINDVRRRSAEDSEAKRQQILQSMQERGMDNSGAALIAQLQAAQSESNQASQQADELAAQASRNALQALTNVGNLSGSMRSADFGEASTRAKAADELSRFNIENQRAIQQRNVLAKNVAQEANLRQAQALSDKNIGQSNTELLRQNEAKRQLYQDKLDKARAMAGGYQQRAKQFEQQGEREANQWAEASKGVGSIFGSLITPD